MALIDTADLARAAFVVIGLAMAGVVHVLWLRTAWSRRFDQPLDGGARWRGRRVFGPNKTLRGLLAMPVAAALAFPALLLAIGSIAPPWVRQLWPLSATAYGGLGFACGVAFMLAELPNSLLKRQLGVAPGALPNQGWLRPLCAIVDRLDSTLGVLLLLTLLPGVGATIGVWVWAILLGPVLHAGFSIWLHRSGVKSRAL